MPRRGENIYKRKDGRWEGRFIKGRQTNGKAMYSYVYGKTYSEVKQKLLDKRIAFDQEIKPSQCQAKYKDILHDWLVMSRLRTKESTYSRYVHLSKLHILPYLGDIPLDLFTAKAVECHINFLLSEGRISGEGGLAPKTVSDVLSIIKGSIDYARHLDNHITCHLEYLTIKKPQVDMRVLSLEEHKRLLAVLLHDTDFPKLGVLLCLYTGIRIGEVCALKWENINFLEGTLSIRETLQRIQNVDDVSNSKTKIVVTPPKSKKSIRVIPLPESLSNIICEFQSSPKAYVLTGRTDKFMEPRSLQYRFKKYASESGIFDVRYHALRHTFATRCIELGFDAKTLSDILGHTNVNITLNRYVHSSLEIKKNCMQRLRL